MNTYDIATNWNDQQFDIHRHGCADVARGIRTRKYSDSYAVTAESAAAAVADEVAAYEAQDQGFFTEDFRIMPCAR